MEIAIPNEQSSTDVRNPYLLKRKLRFYFPLIGKNEESKISVLRGFNKGENWLSLQKAFVKDGWDEEDSKGTDVRCKVIALELAEFLDDNNIPEGFAYPKYDGGIGFMWAPGRTKKLKFEAEIEFSEDNEDEIVFFIYASENEVEIFNDYLSDYAEFTAKILQLFKVYKEIL